jgi:hypothetical protein
MANLFNIIFILFFRIDLIINQANFKDISCGVSNPKNSTECNLYNDKDNLCCFLQPINAKDQNMCYKYEISKYFGQGNINYAQKTYHVYCGLGTTTQSDGVSKFCGVLHPSNDKNCSYYSTIDNSCCYYSYDGIKGCYWLGIKFGGHANLDHITLICASAFIKSNYFFILSIFILLNLNFFKC